MMLHRLLPLVFSLACGLAAAQATPLRFGAYLDAVEQGNLDLAAQREAVLAARAGVSVAGVSPDPSLSWGLGPQEFSREVQPKPRLAQSLGLSWTLETAGKRSRRVQAAQSAAELAQASADGARNDLFSTAASAFAEACRSGDALARQESTLRSLSDIVRANELRRQAGDLGGLEFLQSRSERDQYQAAVVKARADALVARLNLAVPLGASPTGPLAGRPLDCNYEAYEPGDDVDTLVERGLRERDDVRIARAALANARDNASLTQANRHVDPSIGISYGYTPHGRSSIDADGSPVGGSARSNTVSLSLSVPIPLSRLQRGELVQAESAVTQAMLALRQAELKAEADVRATHAQFLAARENLARYRDSVLADSQKVLEGMQLSYRHGGASLLELLNAQRSADDAWLSFLQAQADLANATVKLQLSLARRPSL